MNCRDFHDHMLAHVDGELPGDLAAAAAHHADACEACRGRAAFERALEARIGAALLSDAPAPDVAALLRSARPPVRLLTLRRAVVAAAALLIVVQAAWFFCIPPFECAYLQAVEAASTAPREPAAAPTSQRLAGLQPPASIRGYRLVGAPEVVSLGYGGLGHAVRARYEGDDGAFCILWCDPHGMRPSFRRLTRLDGADWWIADENGHNLVAWMCPRTDTLCTLVGELPEERLVTVASDLRSP